MTGMSGSSSRVAKNNSIQFTFRVEQGDSAVKPWLLTYVKNNLTKGLATPFLPQVGQTMERVLGWVCKVPQFQRT